tara:strand:+ start:492 stop:1322 length:831 start_codon:yes stop_codon:yes gene_type:complete
MKIAVTGLGLIEDVDKENPIDCSELLGQERTVLRIEELALYAASKAIKDAKLSIINNPVSVDLVLGVDEGIDDCKKHFFKGLIADGAQGVSPLLFPFTAPNAITARVSIVFSIRGENITFADGCLSSGKAMAYAIDLLKLKKATTVITGGVTHNYAAVAVLEDFEIATKRNATVYGEIVGYGEASVGGHCPAITQALNETGLLPDDVGCLYLNGDAENILSQSIPIKRIASIGGVSSGKAVIDSLLTGERKVTVISVTDPSGYSLSMVIKPQELTQ